MRWQNSITLLFTPIPLVECLGFILRNEIASALYKKCSKAISPLLNDSFMACCSNIFILHLPRLKPVLFLLLINILKLPQHWRLPNAFSPFLNKGDAKKTGESSPTPVFIHDFSLS